MKPAQGWTAPRNWLAETASLRASGYVPESLTLPQYLAAVAEVARRQHYQELILNLLNKPRR